MRSPNNFNGFKPQTPFEGWIYSELMNIKKTLNNHLAHHWAIELALITAIFGLVVARFF